MTEHDTEVKELDHPDMIYSDFVEEAMNSEEPVTEIRRDILARRKRRGFHRTGWNPAGRPSRFGSRTFSPAVVGVGFAPPLASRWGSCGSVRWHCHGCSHRQACHRRRFSTVGSHPRRQPRGRWRFDHPYPAHRPFERADERREPRARRGTRRAVGTSAPQTRGTSVLGASRRRANGRDSGVTLPKHTFAGVLGVSVVGFRAGRRRHPWRLRRRAGQRTRFTPALHPFGVQDGILSLLKDSSERRQTYSAAQYDPESESCWRADITHDTSSDSPPSVSFARCSPMADHEFIREWSPLATGSLGGPQRLPGWEALFTVFNAVALFYRKECSRAF